MKLFAPKYYNQFKCIADKCEHSCCIGWEIDIDDGALERYKALECGWEIDVDKDTAEKYASLTDGYGKEIAKSIEWGETPHFKLCEGDRCPHLDERGLCRIILNVGEDHLCGICREHPRFYNYTDVAEVGLGMSCREAARLILSSPNYYVTEAIGQTDAEELCLTFNGRLERERVFDILQGDTLDYQARIKRIRSDYGIASVDDCVWLEMIV